MLTPEEREQLVRRRREVVARIEANSDERARRRRAGEDTSGLADEFHALVCEWEQNIATCNGWRTPS
jgi:hypothetical protein